MDPARDDSERLSVLRTLKWSGFVLGFGLGGHLDGIVLHQILQWHHMISSRVPIDSLRNLQINTLADGIFNGSMWLVTFLGLVMLWKGVTRGPHVPLATRNLIGWGFVGWGAFQIVDSLTFHALLGLHHIREGPNFLLYDYAFFFLGLVFLALGAFLTRETKPMLDP